MSNELLGFCPICKEKLTASRLTCHHCGVEFTGDFALSRFHYLTEKELLFIEMYLKCKGNLKELQQNLKISYPNAKKQFYQVLLSLGFSEEVNKDNKIEVIVSELPMYQDESEVIRTIKKRLNFNNGFAVLPLQKGGNFQICYESFGNGILATNLPSNKVLIWAAFDAAVTVMKNNGGKALKGQAMSAKLGEPGLTLDTVEGYVAHHAYGVKKGESALRMISALSSILEWAGICNNCYGYLELKKDL